MLEAVVIDPRVGAASALKMCYAAWTKGSAALLTATRALALAEGVEAALLVEWSLSKPELEARSAAADIYQRLATYKDCDPAPELSELIDTILGSGT